MNEEFSELIEIFLDVNSKLLEKDCLLFQREVSERTICGALMSQLYEKIKEGKYSDYYVDVEYNRNGNKKVKTYIVKENECEYKNKYKLRFNST